MSIYTVETLMKEFEKLGTAQTVKTLKNHGAPDNIFGVKIGDMKPFVKKIKKDYQLAKDLFATGNSDAMYFAGLIGDETKMTKADFNLWVNESTWGMISEYSVPFVAAESPLGWELAMEWIESEEEQIAVSGWATLSLVISILPNENLDIKGIKKLLKRIEKNMQQSMNRVKYVMNGFVISVGCYIPELTNDAKIVAKNIGIVSVNMGDTSCKVPDAIRYIEKVELMNRIGQKRKSARC